MFIGIETMGSQNLAAARKNFNDPLRLRSRVRAIHREGIPIIAGMMTGFDGDDVCVFERDLEFLRRTHIEALQLNIVTPLPGTPLYGQMEGAGRVCDHDWSHYDFRHVVFRPAGMTATQLQDGADWLYSQFYRLDRVLPRTLRTAFLMGWTPAWLTLKRG